MNETEHGWEVDGLVDDEPEYVFEPKRSWRLRMAVSRFHWINAALIGIAVALVAILFLFTGEVAYGHGKPAGTAIIYGKVRLTPIPAARANCNGWRLCKTPATLQALLSPDIGYSVDPGGGGNRCYSGIAGWMGFVPPGVWALCHGSNPYGHSTGNYYSDYYGWINGCPAFIYYCYHWHW